MTPQETVCIHFILNNTLLFKRYEKHIPLSGDEIRVGGKGNEKFYTVGRRVWVFDEPENPHQRINIEITEAA